VPETGCGVTGVEAVCARAGAAASSVVAASAAVTTAVPIAGEVRGPDVR